MHQRASLWTLLAPNSGLWCVELQNGGFVQLSRAGKHVGAFAFANADLLGKKMGETLRPLGDLRGLEAKLVVSSGVSTVAGAALKEYGVVLGKVVEREEAFELRFDSSAQKIFVTKPQPAPIVAAKGKIRVLIVDDSVTIRKVLHKILSSDPELEVVGGVGLPSEVEAAIEKFRPDVITLDIHLPEMNGVELLKRYLPKYRIPTVMISSISVEEGPLVLNALEAGAVDYIQKPSAHEIESVSPFIILKVKTASKASLQESTISTHQVSRTRGDFSISDLSRVVAIGSSTGGTEALKEVFVRLPEKIPPIVVVQHIPAVFSKAFADRMNQLCPFEVLEGADGMEIKPGRAIIAPGGMQMSVKKWGDKLCVQIEDSAPVNRHKPSVDVLMESVAKVCGGDAIGAILTGMGSDGAKGLLAMKNAGSATFAQNEATCVVYGMPQAAFKLGATDVLVPLENMAETIVGALTRKKRSA